jgi:putative alpha-1,2-mannosidase
LAPTTFSEVNNVYLGFDMQVHTVDQGFENYYTDMSIWDVFRTQFPLLTLLKVTPAALLSLSENSSTQNKPQPDRMNDILQSLVNMYEQGGSVPRWPLANGE